MTNNHIQIYATAKPFSNLQVKRQVLPGATVEELVGIYVAEKIRNSQIKCNVEINGYLIDPSNWHLVKPKTGTVVNIHVIPQGGGGGKKNPLATVLTIALLVAAPYAGAYLAASFSAASSITMATSIALGKAFTVGVGIIGALAINALAPPPKQDRVSAINNPAESPTQFIEGASNQLLPYGVVPVCLGTNRMFPPQCARPYTETVDGNQYVRQLFTYGWGNKVVFSEPKFGETLVSQFTDIDMEHRLNGDLHLGTGIFPEDVFQDDYNVLLEEVGGYITRTTQPDIDEALVDITFPRGLITYNDSGAKLQRTVLLDISYAPTGTSDWSPGLGTFSAYSADDIDITEVPLLATVYDDQYLGFRKDLVVLDKFTGISSIVLGTSVYATEAETIAPELPTNKIRLSTIVVESSRPIDDDTITTEVISFTNDISTSLIGTIIEDNADFVVSTPSPTASVHVAAGGLSSSGIEVTDARTEAIRITKQIVFPTNGTYDIRIKRVTDDSDSDKIFDFVYLTSIKSIIHRSPVRLQGQNGTAIRIKATDQLNGSIDQFNVVVSNIIPDFDPETGDWTDKITSNPASLYRYVLQCDANARALTDSKIDIDTLEDWHVHCTAQGYTYNRVIDYRSTVDQILADIASAGSASPTLIDGKRSVVIDRLTDDIPQIITPRNSWGYRGEMTYPEPPHALRVNFRNKEKGYVQDELIVYNDGYNSDTATIFESLSLPSCTNSDLAYKTARRHFADAILRPEIHSWSMDVENLSFSRGARVKFISDVPKVGVGQGRIKEIFLNEDEDMVTGFSIDDTVTIPTVGYYFTRIRLADGTQLYKEFSATIGYHTSFNFVTPFTIDDTPAIGDLAYFVEAGKELDLVVTRIEPAPDYTAKIIARDYAPEVFDAENSTIPPFESNITSPLEFIRPVSPIVSLMQSDESVMLRNSDGSLLTRLIITLQNDNEGEVITYVKFRPSGSTIFNNPTVLESSPDRTVLTGFQDGVNYDFEIRYRRANSSVMSAPTKVNSYKFIGASGKPDTPTNFTITISGSTALFKWDKCPNIDFKNSTMKFSRAFVDAEYVTSQVIEEEIYENRLSLPFIPGTYFLKHRDILGNESDSPAVIITYDPGILFNQVAVLQESDDFLGVKDNVELSGGDSIVLDDATLDGYYYFDNDLDLGAIFTCIVSSEIIANGAFTNDIFDMLDVFEEEDVYGSGDNDVFEMSDIFEEEDVFGIGTDAWEVQLEFRITNDDPGGSPTWTDWATFNAGTMQFRGIEFRLLMRSLTINVTPQVTSLSVNIDMPDRIERGEDLTCDSSTGGVVAYATPFRNNPAVAITLQDAAVDDRIEFISKTSSGFTFKVYNGTLASYVTRSYDYIASGFGRLITL